MTALTWRECKRIAHCLCPSPDRYVCARIVDADVEACTCSCHVYRTAEDTANTKLTEQRQ